MTNSGGMSDSRTMNPQGGSMGTQGNMQGNMGSQGNMQGNMGGRMMRGEAGERQMTECLNMAASPKLRSLPTLKRIRAVTSSLDLGASE